MITEAGSTVGGLIRLARPRQWVKNGFVLAPLMFTAKFSDTDALQQSGIALVLFCIASSAAYIVNDLHDREHDRRHPVKSRKRPLASGQVTVRQAVTLLVGLYGILGASYLIAPGVLAVIGGYLLLNLAYSFFLKHQAVVDIFTVAIGFVLRVYAGAVALDVPVSSWMFVTTLCLALYLASIKRRQELRQQGDETRRVLRKYNVALVDRYAEMSATGALLFYSLFVMNARPELVITIPLVLFGLFRYWYIVESKEGGESPTEALLGDWQMIGTVALWGAACAWKLSEAGVNG
jgi:4-hydroxybenzoate polyprenyltransferase